MRYIYSALIAILAGIVILFTLQNFQSATVSILSMGMTLPLSLLVLLVYVLGMLTGGLALALVRSWIRGATQRRG